MLVALLVGPAAAPAAVHLRSRSIEPGTAARLTVPDSPDGLYVLVADRPVTASLRRDLEDAGVLVHAYVPDDALLASVPRARTGDVARKPYLTALLVLDPADKVSPSIATPAWPDEPGLLGLLTVQAVPGADLDRIAEEARLLLGAEVTGFKRAGTYPRLTLRVAGGGEAEAAHALAALPGVLWVERAGLVRWLNDSSIWVGQSWDTLGFATPVFARGLFGEGQIVGISDTGLDADHGSFYDAREGLPGPAVNLRQRKVIAYHDRLGDGNWGAFNHGTHVAGIVAGDLDGDGVWDANAASDAPDGMAPAARLAISDADDTCLPGNPIDLRELFLETYGDGARLHNNSWGSCDCNEYTVHSQDVDDFLWANRDMAVFFAAGNSGGASLTVISPGTAKDAITVGATQRAAAADTLAGFSSKGPTDDGRLKPTITAPGRSIRSALGDGDINSFNRGVAAFSGTSMATPTAAGYGALLREYLVKGFYPGGAARPQDAIAAPSAALVTAMLVNSGRNMLGETPAPSIRQGWGRVLLDDVLYFTGDRRRLWLKDDARGLEGPGEKRSFALVVGAGEPDLKVTLAWTDPPAATLVGPKIVNDLDLVVSGPADTYLGNVFAGEFSATGGAPDRLNVIEGVRVQDPAPGRWTVTVEAAAVPFGPQPFALVVTGNVALAPHLSLASFSVSDPQGDRDGRAEPGELVELDVTLVEDGGSPATGIRARLVPLDANTRVVAPDVRAFADVAAGGETRPATPWRLAIDGDAPCAATVNLRLAIETDQGAYEEGLAVPVAAAVVNPTVVLLDGFDALAPGSPPSPTRWRTGFAVAPTGNATLRVETDASVEPAGSPASSPPNALYIGRARGGTDATASYLETLPLDLRPYDRATLTLRYWVRELEGGIATRDRFSVLASTDGGASFPVLLYANPDYASGMDSASYPDRRWHEVTLDLAAARLLADRLVLRLTAEVNSDEPDDAIYVDDVRLVAESVNCDPGCIPPVLAVASPAPVCLGSPATLAATVLAEGFGVFDGSWDFGDGTILALSRLDESVDHGYLRGGAYVAVLEAVSRTDPSCRSRFLADVAVDELPTLDPQLLGPVCTADPTARLQAPIAVAGYGPRDYTWDLGDGSPLQPAADPRVVVGHVYPALPSRYQVSITAADPRVPGCARSFPLDVDVLVSVIPTGTVGNRLRAWRDLALGLEVRLGWSGATVNPRNTNVHRTDAKDRLVESASILGLEPVIARPSGVEAAVDDPFDRPVWFYKVVPRDDCNDVSVFP